MISGNLLSPTRSSTDNNQSAKREPMKSFLFCFMKNKYSDRPKLTRTVNFNEIRLIILLAGFPPSIAEPTVSSFMEFFQYFTMFFAVLEL